MSTLNGIAGRYREPNAHDRTDDVLGRVEHLKASARVQSSWTGMYVCIFYCVPGKRYFII